MITLSRFELEAAAAVLAPLLAESTAILQLFRDIESQLGAEVFIIVAEGRFDACAMFGESTITASGPSAIRALANLCEECELDAPDLEGNQ